MFGGIPADPTLSHAAQAELQSPRIIIGPIDQLIARPDRWESKMIVNRSSALIRRPSSNAMKSVVTARRKARWSSAFNALNMARTARSIWTVSAFVHGHVRDSAGVDKIATIVAMSSFNRMTPPGSSLRA